MSPDDSATARKGDYETAVSADDHLDVRIWLRLLTCTNMIEGRVRRNLREEFDFTLPRFDLLAQLDRAETGLTMGELSRRLMVSNGNVTGLIDRLVGEGLVARKPAPADRRAQMVTLTAAGRKAFDAMWPQHQRWINAMLAGLNRKELEALFALLGKLKQSLAAAEGAGASTRQGER
jgi:DNA-binding MarR family transcriptional regulator